MLLYKLSHVRLHIKFAGEDEAVVYDDYLGLIPAPNLVSLFLDSPGIQEPAALRKLLLESNQLKMAHFYGDIGLPLESGQFPPVQELII